MGILIIIFIIVLFVGAMCGGSSVGDTVRKGFGGIFYAIAMILFISNFFTGNKENKYQNYPNAYYPTASPVQQNYKQEMPVHEQSEPPNTGVVNTGEMIKITSEECKQQVIEVKQIEAKLQTSSDKAVNEQYVKEVNKLFSAGCSPHLDSSEDKDARSIHTSTNREQKEPGIVKFPSVDSFAVSREKKEPGIEKLPPVNIPAVADDRFAELQRQRQQWASLSEAEKNAKISRVYNAMERGTNTSPSKHTPAHNAREVDKLLGVAPGLTPAEAAALLKLEEDLMKSNY